jgi:hypothetical protein
MPEMQKPELGSTEENHFQAARNVRQMLGDNTFCPAYSKGIPEMLGGKHLRAKPS